jgi:hypothetical protein
MRIPVSIAFILAVVACHKTPEVQPHPLRVVGDFSFRMNIGVTPVEGEFSIARDTVSLGAENHSCRGIDLGVNEPPLSHAFTCGGGPTSFQVVIDSKQPSLSRWASTRPVTKSQLVCVKWAITKEGQQVCSQSRQEIYTENVRIGGRLHVTRIAAADSH